MSSYLQPVVKNCKHVVGSHAPIIDWAETAQLEEHDIMFTFDIEAHHPSIQVWPLCWWSLSFRRCRTSHSTFLFPGTRPGRVSCEVAAPCPVYTAHAVRRFLFRGHMGLVHWSSVFQVSRPNLYLDVLDSHVWQGPEGALECPFPYIDDGFGVLDSRKISVHELQCLLNGWNASIKVPSVETCSPLPFLDLALEKRVLDERNRKFGVKFSTFRKKLSIYSYVPGDSDHHLCMMQSTIRGELTRLLRTNSSVDSFEQEVQRSSGLSGLGEVMMAKISIVSPRFTRGSPRKRWLEARRKSSPCPLCAKYSIRGVCVFSLFEELSTSM